MQFGVLGFPVKHSLSPSIHNLWFKENNIQAQYHLLECEKIEDLENFIASLEEKNFAGINVTLPYKNAMFEILKNKGFEISENAELLKSVNTVDFRQKIATNTDIHGFLQICKVYEDDHVLVIGGGGVASSVIAACQISNPHANITITNRTIEKAQAISENLMCDLYLGDLSKLDLSNFEIIINATSLGLNGEILPLHYNTLRKSTKCYDTIYYPKITPFLESAKSRGCQIQNGVMMLVHQAAKAFELWHDVKPSIDLGKKVMKDFLT